MLFKSAARNRLINNIVDACRENAERYTDSCCSLFEKYETASEKIIAREHERYQKEYFRNVENSVFKKYSADMDTAFIIKATRNDPSIIGNEYSSISPQEAIGAGKIFAIYSYAILKEVANPHQCIELNHRQGAIMNHALSLAETRYQMRQAIRNNAEKNMSEIDKFCAKVGQEKGMRILSYEYTIGCLSYVMDNFGLTHEQKRTFVKTITNEMIDTYGIQFSIDFGRYGIEFDTNEALFDEVIERKDEFMIDKHYNALKQYFKDLGIDAE